MSNNVGKWIGWSGIGVGAAVIIMEIIWWAAKFASMSWLFICLGAAAAIAGIAGCYYPQKILNVIAIVVGAVAVILGIVL